MLKMSEPGFLFSIYHDVPPCGNTITCWYNRWTADEFFKLKSLFIFVGQKLTKMTKADIVKQLAQETGVEAVTVLAVVEGFMEEVRAAQIRKENVFLRGFGTFLIKHRKEKTARNITKNTTIKIPAHDIPAFKPSPAFQRLLEKK